MPEFHVIQADGWLALYRDGVSVYQGHDLPVFVLKDYLGVKTAWAQGQADEEGSFPGLLERVRLDEGESFK